MRLIAVVVAVVVVVVVLVLVVVVVVVVVILVVFVLLFFFLLSSWMVMVCVHDDDRRTAGQKRPCASSLITQLKLRDRQMHANSRKMQNDKIQENTFQILATIRRSYLPFFPEIDEGSQGG